MNEYMELAIKEAKKSLKSDDVPVGAIIVENNKIIAKAHNTKEKSKIVTRHAEINAVEKACKKKNNWYLNNCEIYITLEPCPMCLNVLLQAHIKKIYYAAAREKELKNNDNKEQIIAYKKQAQKLLKDFFENKRK